MTMMMMTIHWLWHNSAFMMMMIKFMMSHQSRMEGRIAMVYDCHVVYGVKSSSSWYLPSKMEQSKAKWDRLGNPMILWRRIAAVD
jgi:hypothetical protein